jgi:hypothetical protein
MRYFNTTAMREPKRRAKNIGQAAARAIAWQMAIMAVLDNLRYSIHKFAVILAMSGAKAADIVERRIYPAMLKKRPLIKQNFDPPVRNCDQIVGHCVASSRGGQPGSGRYSME